MVRIIFQMFLRVTGSLSGPGNWDTIVDSEKIEREHYFIPFLFAGHLQKLETCHAATQSEAGKNYFLSSSLSGAQWGIEEAYCQTLFEFCCFLKVKDYSLSITRSMLAE